MPAATTKTDLLATTEAEFSKLTRLLDRVPVAARAVPDAGAEGTTLKDTVGHRAHWIDLFLGWYRAGQTGAQVAIPAPGYKWNDLKRYNADLRVAQQDMTWDDARDLLTNNHDRLLTFLNALSETDLYGAPMKGGNSKWTTGRWAEAAGAAHYRSAAKYIRTRLRAFEATHYDQF